MKVFELAALRGVNAKELAKELGLKSHLSVVPESERSDIPATVVVSTPSLKAESSEQVLAAVVNSGVSEEVKRQSIRGLGTKSKFWSERVALGIK
jgi:dsRNA-specific ribonuclease